MLLVRRIRWIGQCPRALRLGLLAALVLPPLTGGCGDKVETGAQSSQVLNDDYDASLRAAQANAADQKAAAKKPR